MADDRGDPHAPTSRTTGTDAITAVPELIRQEVASAVASALRDIPGTVGSPASGTYREQKFQQIFVEIDGEPMVTYDNNTDNNHWNYHRGQTRPHITEAFQVLPVEEGPGVNIIGFYCMGSGLSKWNLSVREDPAGVTDRFPRFRPEDEPVTDDAPTLHTVFTQEDNDEGMTAFSFMTNSDDAKVYLVPTLNRRRRIESKVTDEAQYVFRLGPTITPPEILKLINQEPCDYEPY